MRCEPMLSGSKLTQTMWLKNLAAISLLTLSNVAQHFHLIELVFPYHLLVNLVINNIVCLFCSHQNINIFWDFVWKLTTALSQLNDYCFQVKVALDTLIIVKQVIETYQIKPIKRFHKQDQQANTVTTYLERRPSIHKTKNNLGETKVNETFLAHKIYSLNLGKSSNSSMTRNVKKTSESDSLGGIEFPKVKLNTSAYSASLIDEIPNTWGSSSQCSSKSSDKSSPSSASSLLKPSRLSFSSHESQISQKQFSPTDNQFSSPERLFSSPNALSLPRESLSSPSAAVSQTLFYSSTPRVVYVQMPSSVAEQGYLKLVCYLFTLVIVYIIYNEYRIARIYQTPQQHIV